MIGQKKGFWKETLQNIGRCWWVFWRFDGCASLLKWRCVLFSAAHFSSAFVGVQSDLFFPQETSWTFLQDGEFPDMKTRFQLETTIFMFKMSKQFFLEFLATKKTTSLNKKQLKKQSDFESVFPPESPKSSLNFAHTHTIHVWYIYLHLP